MGETLRLLEGRFGRLAFADVAAGEAVHSGGTLAVLLPQACDDVVFLNPGDSHTFDVPARAIIFHAAQEWLQASFPALVSPDEARPFPLAKEPITERIRQLADALAIEIMNDRFLSTDRVEFMLQELLFSIVESYLARKRAASPLWRGSRFEDSRIRRALALLRARPNKDMNIDSLASEVGLSRSRFYDLFQICTGFSPRAYLDMLCVETAISRLSSGRGKIAELASELGFSAQSNFTRFFLNQVGVPPSEYRRAATDKALTGKPDKSEA
jgi:AraC-like DNA-binding protein